VNSWLKLMLYLPESTKAECSAQDSCRRSRPPYLNQWDDMALLMALL
jgi:hypothetical protein